jgi:hypothetical protein
MVLAAEPISDDAAGAADGAGGAPVGLCASATVNESVLAVASASKVLVIGTSVETDAVITGAADPWFRGDP